VGDRRSHDLARHCFEAGDQAHVPLRTPDLVPREPETVRVTQRRLAVVFRQVLTWKDILAGRYPRFGLRGLFAGIVIGVDGQRAIDTNGLFVVCGIEHQPSTKAADGRLVGLAEDRIGPNGGYPGGRLRLVVVGGPGDILREVESCAAAGDRHADQGGSRPEPPGGGISWSIHAG
jgi:hypothetical protein